MNKLKYERILLKLSGESFQGERTHGLEPNFIAKIALEIKAAFDTGVHIGIVIGGGNFFRGLAAEENGLERATGDYIGMLATVMNALALQETLEKTGVDVRVQSAVEMPGIAEPYIRRRAIRHMEKGRVVIFAAGTGNPYFTTDTAGALRALETNADVFIKATKVDGVYSKDPKTDPQATKFETLSYSQVMENDHIAVMDKNAIQLCKDNKLPVLVFNVTKEGNLARVLKGENIGTVIS